MVGYGARNAKCKTPDAVRARLTHPTLYIGGNEVYAKEKANALEAELRPLVGADIITGMSKFDTNPAHNPQPPARYRK